MITRTLPPTTNVEKRPSQEDVSSFPTIHIGGAVLRGERTSFPTGISTADEFSAWAKAMRYGDGKRGTYHNRDSYLYLKACLAVQTEADATAALAAVRFLTSKGVLHPDTQWGAFKQNEDAFNLGDEVYGYQLFAVSPKIEAFSIDDHLGTPDYERLIKPITDKNSALFELCRRVEPDFQDEESIAPDSLLQVVNLFEASEIENWGRDKHGVMYPIDVEVMSAGHHMDVVRKWYDEQRQVSSN